MTTQRPTFTQRGGDGAGFFYLLASGGSAPGSINFDFTTGVLPGAITFTRASIGTYANNAGTLITAGNDVARFNYIAGVANLLIEGSATNLFLQSNNFANAAWFPYQSSTLTAAQFVSPDGTNNGWLITSSAASTAGCYQQLTISNIPYTMSIWAKQIASSNTLDFYMNAAVSSSNTPLSTVIARLFGTTTPAAGSNKLILNRINLTGNGQTNGFYGAQFETGSVPTSYIPTTTTTVTRAADSAVFTIPSGVGHLTYTFDDNSTQLVTVSAGSYTVPTTLNRPNIKSIVGSA